MATKLEVLKLPQGEVIVLARNLSTDNGYHHFVVTRAKSQSTFYALTLGPDDEILVFRRIINLLDFDFERLKDEAHSINKVAVKITAERVKSKGRVIRIKDGG